MKALLVGGVTGISIGLLWHWSLLRTVNLLASNSTISIARIICDMAVRLSIIAAVLGMLVIRGGLYYMLSALATMMVVRSYLGSLAVRSTAK
jgi:hypothetical protein